MGTRLGTQVGNYRLTHLLGEGGFAQVYLGEQIYLGTQAAVKLLQAPLASAKEIEQFHQEARTIAGLLHPQIIRVLDFGMDGNLPYLVLDYAPGGSLRQQHPAGTHVPLSLVVAYVRQIAQALQYAHDQKVIHRDIKPQNLLLGRNGAILLADFGISVVAQTTSRQQVHGFAGTVAYTAPEQVQEHPRPASDQYALGVVVYEWLTGELPFTGTFQEVIGKHLFAVPPPLRAHLPTLPSSVEQVVLIALAKDPKDRFGSVQAFANALEQASREVTGAASPSTQHAPLSSQAPSAEEGVEAAKQPPRTSALPSSSAGTPPVPVSHVHSAGSAAPAKRMPTARSLLLATFLIVVVLGGSIALLVVNGKKPPAASAASQSTATVTSQPGTTVTSQLTATATSQPALGIITQYTLPTPGDHPAGITVGPDGDLWFTEFAGNRIGRITPQGGLTQFALPHPGSGPWGITVGPDGNLWFAEEDGNQIGRMTPQGALTEFHVATSDSHPYGITKGPDGNLWFTEEYSNRIGRITPAGTITEFAPLAASSAPAGITIGPDGNLWFTEYLGNRIGRITLNGAITQYVLAVPGGTPAEITAGPDGNLWFTEKNSNQIGRITPGGTFTEFAGLTANSHPVEITAGPDGNLWFTDFDSNQIGRITTGR